MENKGLCWRCEFRATYLENNIGPRCECGDTHMAVASCYMYRPVVPIVLHARQDDNRPAIAPPMLAARSVKKGLANQNDLFVLDVKIEKNGDFTFFWRPKYLEIYSNTSILLLLNYILKRFKNIILNFLIKKLKGEFK